MIPVVVGTSTGKDQRENEKKRERERERERERRTGEEKGADWERPTARGEKRGK